MTTRIQKGREGWTARTEIKLGFDSRVLVINTHKTTGGMVTGQQVMKLDAHGYMSFVLFQDFNTSTVFKGVRCTEKTVRELHQQALEVSDLTMSAAAKHYGHIDAPAEPMDFLEYVMVGVPSTNEFQGVAA